MREAHPTEQIENAEFIYRMLGPGAAEHNYFCAVCRRYKAVLHLNTGILQPCWDCQIEGYRVIKMNWLERKLNRGSL